MLRQESLPVGTMFGDEDVRGYFVDFRAKTLLPEAEDVWSLLPVDLAQLGLGWWERTLRGESLAVSRFAEVCSVLAKQGEQRRNDVRWPYFRFISKYGLSPPWYSAMAQGEIASVFVRSYLSTGDDDHAGIASDAIQPLLNGRTEDLVHVSAAGPILEEAPTDPPSHILNGWIFTLWGLWDVSKGLGDRRAAALFDASIECLRRMLPRYDVGWWSRYSLYPHSLADLAKPYYHALHVNQLEILYRLTGYLEFRETALRWAAYDRTGRRILAAAQKAPFLVKDYPARRSRLPR